jgi:hypothetical protein
VRQRKACVCWRLDPIARCDAWQLVSRAIEERTARSVRPPDEYARPCRDAGHERIRRPAETQQAASDEDAVANRRGDAPHSEATSADEPAPRGRSEGEADEGIPRSTRREDAVDQPSDLASSSDESGRPEPGSTESAGDGGSLLPDEQSERFTARWHQIQAAFVDEPRESVTQADALVADLMQRLAASFSNERERLGSQWDRGDDVSTEELRVALTRYRSFFERLLSA